MSQQGKGKLSFLDFYTWLLYLTKSWNFSCVPYAHSHFLYSRVANLAFLKPYFKILAFIEHLSLFWKWKSQINLFFFWLMFSRIGLALAKHCLSCIFITSGVQRSGDGRGDCLIGCPLPNSSIEQWRMVVIVTGCISVAREGGKGAMALSKF